jgi:hypothetical protein
MRAPVTQVTFLALIVLVPLAAAALIGVQVVRALW